MQERHGLARVLQVVAAECGLAEGEGELVGGLGLGILVAKVCMGATYGSREIGIPLSDSLTGPSRQRVVWTPSTAIARRDLGPYPVISSGRIICGVGARGEP